MFIAVNSGNSKKNVAAYAKQNKIPWPILVDEDRQFEKLCGLQKPISLKNIYQVKFLTAEGELRNGSFSKVDETAYLALKGASWRIDPEGIPDQLRPAWSKVEFGNYRAAAVPIMKARRSKDASTKSAASLLLKSVMGEMRAEAQEAWETGKSGSRWESYRQLDAICEKYEGYPIPPKLVALRDKYAKEPAIISELKASKVLAAAEGMLATNDERKRKTAQKRLRLLLEKFPKTLSAQRAEALIVTDEESESDRNDDEYDDDEEA